MPGDSQQTSESHPRGARRAERWLLGLVDLCIAGVILLLPFIMGGRQALGQLVLVTLSVAVAFTWCLRQCLRQKAEWRNSPAELLLMGGLLLIAAQLVAWPAGFNLWSSPNLARILPLWNGAAPLGAWRQVSLSPAATQNGLALYVAYALLFLVVVQRIGEVADVERLLGWIALCSAAMAAFGLVQYLFGNGKFFWFHEHPFADTHDVVKGAFTNRNHFADFLALGIGPIMWSMQAGVERKRRSDSKAKRFLVESSGWSARDALKLLALAVVVFAGLMSLSRAGMSVMLLAGAVSVGIYFHSGLVGRRFVLALAGLTLLVAALLTIHGAEGLTERLRQLTSGSFDELDQNRGRRRVWEATARAIADFPLLGTGVGSHRDVAPIYLDEPTQLEYTHADNSYLQLVEETGTAGAVLAVAGLALCGWWCVAGLRSARSPRSVACLGAVAAGLVANAVHAVVDFVWYVPGCMAIVVTLAACAWRLYQLQSPRAERPAAEISRPTAWIMTVCVLAVGTLLVLSLVGPTLAEPHWHRYLALLRPPANQQGSKSPTNRASSLATAAETVSLAAELACVLSWNPNDARAHLRMAIACLEQFEQLQQQDGRQSLVNLREAALASHFHSRIALQEWLAKVAGTHVALLDKAQWHARRALKLGPLQGEGYLYLSELSFLESADPVLRGAYLDQALRVRPWHGDVLLAAGHSALSCGDVSGAVTCWRRAFHSGRQQQEWIVDQLADQIPVTFFCDYLSPDLPGYRLLYPRYRDLASPDQWTAFLQHYIATAEAIARAESGPPAAQIWLESYHLRVELRDHAGALMAIQQALACDPSEYSIRYFLTQSLLENGRYAQARQHAQWCLQRRSDDASSQQMLKRALRGALALQPQQQVLQR